jgi:hypothetical protein
VASALGRPPVSLPICLVEGSRAGTEQCREPALERVGGLLTTLTRGITFLVTK